MNVERCPATGKISHPTRGSARRHIASLYRHGKGHPDYNVYLCPHADVHQPHWHVGHSAIRLSKRIRRALRGRR